MRLFTIAGIVFVLFGSSMTSESFAQTDDKRKMRRSRESGNQAERLDRMMKRFPLMKALDADNDGQLSSVEIEHAVQALKSLDGNGDGVLDSGELKPGFGQRSQRVRRRIERVEESALQSGDLAPAFNLQSLDGKSKTNLADFKDKKPVVLFFGSYT